METVGYEPIEPVAESDPSDTGGRTAWSAWFAMPLLVVPVTLGATAGTGGVLTADSLRVKNDWVYDASVHVDDADALNELPDTQKQLEFVRATLGLSITDLAEVLEVSRPTVYAWLQGQEPKYEKAMKLRAVSEFAERVEAMGLPGVEKLARRPLSDGSSLLAYLRQGELPEAVLAELRALAEKEARNRKRKKGVGGAKASAREVADRVAVRGDWQG